MEMKIIGLPIPMKWNLSSLPLLPFSPNAADIGIGALFSHCFSSPIPKLTSKSILLSSRHCLLKFRPYVGTNCGNNLGAVDDDDGNDLDGDDEGVDFAVAESSDEIEIEIEKTGKNSRRIQSRVTVNSSLQAVWNILTDYERLADYIPGLVVSRLLEKRDNFARLFQIGQQSLALGLKFNAKGIIDCYEKDLQILPLCKRRDIEFKMVEGDFQLFEGKWSIEQGIDDSGWNNEQNNSFGPEELRTTLSYVVDVKPKLWLPVRLVEGRLCREIKINLSCIREEAERAFLGALYTD